MPSSMEDTHLCGEATCLVCHPPLSPRFGRGVDNPQGFPQAVDKSGVSIAATTAGDPEVAELYPEAQADKGLFYYAMFLEGKLGEARRLVEWFSRKWGDNLDPLFPWRDEFTHTDLPGNRQLADTWYEIVRHGLVCETCEGTRGTLTPTAQERVSTFMPCPACGGMGYFPN